MLENSDEQKAIGVCHTTGSISPYQQTERRSFVSARLDMASVYMWDAHGNILE